MTINRLEFVNGELVPVVREMTSEEEELYNKERSDLMQLESQREPTTAEKLDAIMQYMGLKIVRHGRSNGTFEVVKDIPPKGDYTDPILWEDGQEVIEGMWYYTTDKDLPREAISSGWPDGWDDRRYFDWIEM